MKWWSISRFLFLLFSLICGAAYADDKANSACVNEIMSFQTADTEQALIGEYSRLLTCLLEDYAQKKLISDFNQYERQNPDHAFEFSPANGSIRMSFAKGDFINWIATYPPRSGNWGSGYGVIGAGSSVKSEQPCLCGYGIGVVDPGAPLKSEPLTWEEHVWDGGNVEWNKIIDAEASWTLETKTSPTQGGVDYFESWKSLNETTALEQLRQSKGVVNSDTVNTIMETARKAGTIHNFQPKTYLLKPNTTGSQSDTDCTCANPTSPYSPFTPGSVKLELSEDTRLYFQGLSPQMLNGAGN